jgi:GT2 family glycosyltransferase
VRAAATNVGPGSLSTPVVAAIVLNWNGSHDSIRAIRSLQGSNYPALHVILVDNGSAGDDPASIEDHCPGIVVIRLTENQGFGRAVNLAAAAAFQRGAEHLLLFNNDALIPTGEPVIERLVARLTTSERIGAVGPIIVDDDARRTVQAAGIALRTWFPVPRGVGKGLPYEIARARTFAFDFLQGSCLLVRGSAFIDVNGFDPDFFFYADDADLMVRLKRARYRAALVCDTYVVHRRGSSIRRGSENEAYALIRSMLIFLKKHARWYDLPSAAFTMIATSIVYCGVWRGRSHLAPIGRAWIDFFAGRWGGFSGAWAAGYAAPDFASLQATLRATPSESRENPTTSLLSHVLARVKPFGRLLA